MASPQVTWSATKVDLVGALSAVSCSNVGLCLALDRAGNAFESDNPASGRPVWTRARIAAADGPIGVSCRPVRFCLVADSAGHVIAGVLPGPTVITGTPTVFSQTTAQISAIVNPHDQNVAGCHFDYGSTTAYGLRAPCSPMPRATGGSQAVNAQLGGLGAATSYHFRITAISGAATAAGGDARFTTPAPLTASPSITGTAAVGFVLTCNANIPAATTPTPPTEVAYAWLLDGAPIAGATAATHRVTATDATHHLRCQVSISGDGATTTATSGFDSIPSQTKVRITETHIGAITHRGTRVRVPVTCSSQAAGSCTITLRLTAVLAVLDRRTTITIGVAKAALAAGATHTLTVSLNGKGQLLLQERHRLGAILTVTGTVVGTLVATLMDERLVLADP